MRPEAYPTGKGKTDTFRTPHSLYAQLDAIFNFTLDAACTRNDCKAPAGFYFDEGIDALTIPWGKNRVFCNPPFSRKAEFIAKAYEEVINGECPIVVMILPLNCQSSAVFQKYVKKNFYYETLQGRIQFIHPGSGESMQGNTTGTTIVYFKKDITR
jgi:phage N-6-adenine-methyltransferase